MSFNRIIEQYVNARNSPPIPEAPRHFEEAAQEAPPDVVSQGIAEAFRAEETPPFGQMVAQLFRDSNPQQRSGVLQHLMDALGRRERVEDATPRQVEDLANQAERQNPSVVERVSKFYAQHPALVRNLGTAALTIALARMAQRGRA
jgi:hypothetical protein